ncbi:MAG: hypothetical protein HY248_05825, partial [Fimbriimonas ginsengisoli]|nr:hypothetical protein [Fimbriimonas ginsengisoli]
VLAGAVGGPVIGSIFRRPFEGTFIGIAAGILAAESNSRDGGGVVLKRGDTIGAWFQDGVSISSRTDYGDRGRGDREPCRITYQDRELTFSRDSEPYRSGETVMVPVHRTAEQLGLEVETARSDRALFIQSDDCLLRIEPGSAEYRLNGRRSTLPCPTERRRGVLYAPIEAFAMMRSGTLAVNGTIVEDAS